MGNKELKYRPGGSPTEMYKIMRAKKKKIFNALKPKINIYILKTWGSEKETAPHIFS